MQQVLNKDIFTCPSQPESRLVVCVDNAAWDAEVDNEESSNAGPSDGQPLSPSAMATLVQVSSVCRYKYLLPIFFSKTNLNPFGSRICERSAKEVIPLLAQLVQIGISGS